MLVLVFLGLFLSHGLCQTTGFPGIIPTTPDTPIYTFIDSVTQPPFIPGMTRTPPPPADVTTSTTTTTTRFPGIIPTTPDTPIYTFTDSVTQPPFIPGMTRTPPPPADVTTSTTTTTTTTSEVKPPSSGGEEGKTTKPEVKAPSSGGEEGKGTTSEVNPPSSGGEEGKTTKPEVKAPSSGGEEGKGTTSEVNPPSSGGEEGKTTKPEVKPPSSGGEEGKGTTPQVKPTSSAGEEGKTTKPEVKAPSSGGEEGKTTTQEVKPPSSVGEKSKAKCLEYSKYVFKKVYDSREDDYIERDTCEKSEPLTVGGKYTNPKEFPHQVALGSGLEGEIYWQGGGSLISERFVLSAAHINHVKEGLLALRWARIGDYDLSSTEDEANSQSKSVTIEIEETIPYPSYQKFSFYDDILLIRLKEDVEFGEFIRPICLHTEYDIPKNYGIVTGWGKTKYNGRMSDIMQKVNVSIHRGEQCVKLWARATMNMSHGFDDRKMICAGNPRRDACNTDSGGPLQFHLPKPYYCMYAQIGVVSYGQDCGVYPGGYTRVSEYVSWIEKIVWP